MKLDASVLRREAPMNFGARRVAFLFKRLSLARQRDLVADAPIPTFPAEHPQFQFGHVEPAVMLGRVVELPPLENPSGFGGWKGFVQGRRPMGVHPFPFPNAPHPVRLGIAFIHQPLHLLGEVQQGATFGDGDVPPTTLRLEEHKQIAGAVALVLVIVAFHLTRLSGQRRARLGNQLLGRLVEADLGSLRVVRLSIHLQHVFRGGYELGTDFRNAPLLLLPRLEFVFFNTWRTVSCEIVSASFNSTTRPANKRSVQRAWPTGASLQVSAMSRASCFPSSFRRCPGRRLSFKALGKPPSTKRWRTRSTHGRLTSSASTMSASVKPVLALSKICARFIFRARTVPLLVSAGNSSRSASVKSTMYFLFGMVKGLLAPDRASSMPASIIIRWTEYYTARGHKLRFYTARCKRAWPGKT